MAIYKETSPWKDTPINEGYLDYFRIRPVPAEPDDFLYVIEPQFNRRPDLLSWVLYNTPKLWWVFMQRNLDVIQDPIFDFIPGTRIYVPKGNSLTKILGL